MAYQNVGTPRFYIDWNQYHLAKGKVTGNNAFQSSADGQGSYMSMGTLNPTFQRYISPASDATASNINRYYIYNGWVLDYEDVNWFGLLGHNLGSLELGTRSALGAQNPNLYAGAVTYPVMNWTEGIVNAGSSFSDTYIYPEYDGFTLCKCDGFNISGYSPQDITKNHLDFYPFTLPPEESTKIKFGAFCVGNYYDMPHSPDLNLKMSIEMDGVKNIKTKGGVSLTDINYTKPQDWGDGGAWQLGGVSNLRSGRRVWDLSFSYLSDSDVFPKVAATTNYEAGDSFVDGYPQDNTLLDGTDFFSQVWNRTMGGHLPFIFQPDNTNNNPDQFAICRFDMDSLQYDQVANNVYNVKLKIRESW